MTASRRWLWQPTVALAAGAFAVVSFAATSQPACHAQSGARTAALVELFTSEGCSSCPPADRWLSRNFPAGESANAIGLAFHVDYWDRLGWKDRFATARYTERQYDAMRMNGGTFVYTPQLLLGGHDFDGWRAGAPSQAIAAINAKAPRARIAIDATIAGGRVVGVATASVQAAASRRASLSIALVDNGLVSDVKAGENAGERLTHDHVVRRFVSGAVDGGAARADVDWPLPVDAGQAPTLVAFVQDAGNGDVLQALALPLDGCIR